jgi:hypothetical protein
MDTGYAYLQSMIQIGFWLGTGIFGSSSDTVSFGPHRFSLLVQPVVKS